MAVNKVRRAILRHRKLGSFLLALALLYKVLVPSGFMPVVSDGHVRISLCSGMAPMPMVMDGHGKDHGGHDPDKSGDTHEPPCAFSMSSPALAATDPILVAGALLFILALALGDSPRRAAALPHRLRPPPRGPPLTA